jgi:hypothetical protein
MLGRIARMIRLDASVFHEIEDDPNATSQAYLIVTLSSALNALGFAVLSEWPVPAFIAGFVNLIVGWVVWAATTHYLGRWAFKGRGTLGQMLRLLGYASAPNALGVLALVPCLGLLPAFAAWLLSMVVGVVAVKEALDVSLWAAIGVVIIGALAVGLLYQIFGVIFGAAFAPTGSLSQGWGG